MIFLEIWTEFQNIMKKIKIMEIMDTKIYKNIKSLANMGEYLHINNKLKKNCRQFYITKLNLHQTIIIIITIYKKELIINIKLQNINHKDPKLIIHICKE